MAVAISCAFTEDSTLSALVPIRITGGVGGVLTVLAICLASLQKKERKFVP